MDTSTAPLVLLEPLSTRLERVHSQLEATQSYIGLPKDACAGAKNELALVLEEMKRTLSQWPEEQLQYLFTHMNCAIKLLDAGTRFDLYEETLVALQHLLSAHHQLTHPDALISRLPPELIVKVLNQVHAECIDADKNGFDDKGNVECLRLCSLVHSSWTGIAQPLLFRNISISSAPHFALLTSRVQASPELASKVIGLDLSYLPLSANTVYPVDIATTLRNLPNLRELTVQATEQMNVSEGLNDLVRRPINNSGVAAPQVTAGVTLHHLTLRFTANAPMHPSAPLLATVFPNLRSLTLDDCGTIRGLYLGHQRFSILHSLNLRTFDVQEGGDVSLRDWIELLPSFVVLRCLALETWNDLPMLPELLPSLPPTLSYLYLAVSPDGSPTTHDFGDSFLEAKHNRSIPATLQAVRVATKHEGRPMNEQQQKLYFEITPAVEQACAMWNIQMLVQEKPWEPLELAVEYP